MTYYDLAHANAKAGFKFFLYFLLGACFYVTTSAYAADNTFSPKSCEYTFEFPGQPTYRNIYDPQVGERVEASYNFGSVDDSYFLRAECVAYRDATAINRDGIYKLLIWFAETNGLQYPEYSYAETSKGMFGTIRGYKRVGETQATYIIHVYVGRNSVASMYVGGPSKTFPQPGITAFLNSIKLK
ncbi:MAG: hypothetical protein H6991_02205 [Pseudomonadales bacterium]|nr:hypothetical protein [Pseudomonadales bacterium]